jgi:hypothetical protein
MYTMVLMMAMSSSGDVADGHHRRGGCHGAGAGCYGAAVVANCCAPVAVSSGCHGGGGFLGHHAGKGCHGGGGFLGHHRGGGCHGYATAADCCAPVQSCGCTGMVAGGGCTGGVITTAPPPPVTMPPATPATPVKDKKPQE